MALAASRQQVGSSLWRIALRVCSSRKGRLAAIFTATSMLLIFNAIDYIDFFITHPKNSDFFLYYLAAHIGLTKGWPAMYDPNVYIPALWQASHRWMPYLNPPPMAWLALPFMLIPFPVALTIWNTAMFGALWLAWHLLAPGSRADRYAHLVALLAIYLVEEALRFGQVVCLVMGAIAITWWLIKREKPLLAGMALGLMVLKPQTALLVPVALLAAGYWRVFIGWALVTLPLTIASLVALGPAGLRTYASARQIVYQVASLKLASVNSMVPVPAAIAIGVAAGLLTIATAWRARRRGPELPIAAGLVGSTLVVPYLAAYDFIGLMLSGWLALRVGLPTWAKILLLIGYGTLVLDYAVTGAGPVLVMQCAWMVGLFIVSGRPAWSFQRGHLPASAAA